MCARHRFEFSLASEAEDAELRALLRRIAMPGNITLSFQREPSFLLAEQAGSITSQVMICRDRTKDQIVGMGSRSIRDVYIDGKPARAGYLSMLRGVPEARGNIALARGYRYLRELHTDGAVPYYFTTILDDNTEAKNLLTSARGGLPIYKPLAHLITYLIPLRRNRSHKRASTVINKVDQHQLAEAIAFLQQWNSKYQFAPVYTLADILGQSKLLPAFCPEHFYVYQEKGEIQGTLGIWDQQSFKQTVVTAYSRNMQLARPFYNLYATITGNPGLPPAGSEIKILYASFLSGNASACEALLNRARTDWSGKGYDYLSIGVCVDNPFAQIASHHATQRISSTVYIVYWQDEYVALPQTDRPVHVEVATL